MMYRKQSHYVTTTRQGGKVAQLTVASHAFCERRCSPQAVESPAATPPSAPRVGRGDRLHAHARQSQSASEGLTRSSSTGRVHRRGAARAATMRRRLHRALGSDGSSGAALTPKPAHRHGARERACLFDGCARPRSETALRPRAARAAREDVHDEDRRTTDTVATFSSRASPVGIGRHNRATSQSAVLVARVRRRLGEYESCPTSAKSARCISPARSKSVRFGASASAASIADAMTARSSSHEHLPHPEPETLYFRRFQDAQARQSRRQRSRWTPAWGRSRARPL